MGGWMDGFMGPRCVVEVVEGLSLMEVFGCILELIFNEDIHEMR